ncbi:hypothetical protein ACIOUE_34650 [Streptomyces xanthochromogenes]|uniref:hypothetical protein n=1 Tax=Streptomyces xanthochromogenes TaxID=67384 RepID=UPI0037F406E2
MNPFQRSVAPVAYGTDEAAAAMQAGPFTVRRCGGAVRGAAGRAADRSASGVRAGAAR